MHFSNNYKMRQAPLRSAREMKSTLIREQCTELNVGTNALETAKFVLGDPLSTAGCLHKNRPQTAYLSEPTEGVGFLDCIIVET